MVNETDELNERAEGRKWETEHWSDSPGVDHTVLIRYALGRDRKYVNINTRRPSLSQCLTTESALFG